MKPYREDETLTIWQGDNRQILPLLPEKSVHCCVTSPPYFGLRDYGNEAQIGLEKTPDEYVAELVKVFWEVRRVLRDDGTLWLNLGSSYAGSGKGPSKSLNKEYHDMSKLSLVQMDVIDEPFALRDDLSPDQIAYVFSELAAHFRQSDEVAIPNVTIGINEAVTSFAGSK